MLRFTFLVFFSLLLHLSMYTAVEMAPPPVRPDQTIVELVERPNSITNQSENNFEKPVIKNSTETSVNPSDKPADFIAEKNQRFRKQTRVENSGLFKNSKTKASTNKTTDQAQTSQKSKRPASEKSNEKSRDGELPEFAQAIQSKQMNANLNQIDQMSSSPYDLPRDIEVGLATNLNADAHIYASFYNRVIELFYVRWAQRLDYIFERLPTDVRRQLAGKNWITDLEIVLNSEGVYQKGLILKNSGYKPFDNAGIEAFKDANVFPNPPRAKVEADGFVRLKYRILVRIR